MLAIFTRVIEEEESAQNTPYTESVPGVFDLFLTPEALDRADRASRLVGAESLAAFCRDVIDAEASRILADSTESRATSATIESVAPHPSAAGTASPGSSSPGAVESDVA